MWLRPSLLAALVIVGAVVDWQLWHRTRPAGGDNNIPFVLHEHPARPAAPEPTDYGTQLRAALARGDFDQLDSIAAEDRHADEVFAGDMPKLQAFYDAFSGSPAATDIENCGGRLPQIAIDTLQTDLKAWLVDRPQSIAAHLASARLFIAAAWNARACSAAPERSDRSWTVINARLTDADMMLAGGAEMAKSDPETLWLLIEAGTLRGADRTGLDALYALATKWYPWFTPFYGQHAVFLQDRWGGSRDAQNAYFAALADAHQGSDGEVALSLAAQTLLAVTGRSDFTSFPALGFRRLLDAEQEREANYGFDTRDWNALFLISLWARDCPSGTLALDRIGSDWDPALWETRIFFDDQVAWFKSKDKCG